MNYTLKIIFIMTSLLCFSCRSANVNYYLLNNVAELNGQKRVRVDLELSSYLLRPQIAICIGDQVEYQEEKRWAASTDEIIKAYLERSLNSKGKNAIAKVSLKQWCFFRGEGVKAAGKYEVGGVQRFFDFVAQPKTSGEDLQAVLEAYKNSLDIIADQIEHELK